MGRGFVQLPTDKDYADYFSRQTGKGYYNDPFFVGRPVQRGHGIGSFLFDFLGRRLIPLARQLPAFFRSETGKRLTKNVAKHVINTGAKIAGDHLSESSVPLKQAAKQHWGELKKDLIGEVRTAAMNRQQGSGRRRRRIVRKPLKRRRKQKGGKSSLVEWRAAGRSRKKKKKPVKRRRRRKKADIFEL
jgi:hypothetical protein